MNTCPTRLDRCRPASSCPTGVSPQRQNRTITWLLCFSLVGLLALLLSACGAMHAMTTSSPTATPQQQPLTPTATATPTGPSGDEGPSLGYISLVSASEGWAVGNVFNADPIRGIIMHFHNGAWSQYHTSKPLPQLYGLAMTSASDGWIVGDGGTILRYRNGVWTTVASPVPRPLTSLCMLSPTEGWAGGTDGFFHYQHNTWALVPNSALVLSVTHISMISSSEGWAIGSGGVILHYTQGRWQIVNNDPGFNVYNLAMASASEGWAVGQAAFHANALYYHNGQWQSLQIGSSDTALFALTMLSPTEGWAAGQNNAGGVIYHYLHGQWTQVASPAQVTLHAIAMLSPTEGWGVGDQGKTLHYLNGVWS